MLLHVEIFALPCKRLRFHSCWLGFFLGWRVLPGPPRECSEPQTGQGPPRGAGGRAGRGGGGRGRVGPGGVTWRAAAAKAEVAASASEGVSGRECPERGGRLRAGPRSRDPRRGAARWVASPGGSARGRPVVCARGVRSWRAASRGNLRWGAAGAGRGGSGVSVRTRGAGGPGGDGRGPGPVTGHFLPRGWCHFALGQSRL